MKVDFDSLTEEEMTIWNDRWRVGSTGNTQELLKDLRSCVSARLRNNLQVSTHQIDQWLIKHGWTRTQGVANGPQWQKHQPAASPISADVGKASMSATRMTTIGLASHRPWYMVALHEPRGQALLLMDFANKLTA